MSDIAFGTTPLTGPQRQLIGTLAALVVLGVAVVVIAAGL